MSHMLGRFVCTLSFSRISSPGLLMGETRFGSCFCENGPLTVFIISYPIHPLFVVHSCSLGYSLVQSLHWSGTGPWRCSASLIWSVLAPMICFQSEKISVALSASLTSRASWRDPAGRPGRSAVSPALFGARHSPHRHSRKERTTPLG